LSKDQNALEHHNLWRNSLKVGDIIDVIKENTLMMKDDESRANCKGWTRAKITYITESEEDDNGNSISEE